MFQLDEIQLLDRKFMGLLVFDAGDDEQWAVGDDDQVCAAVGRAVIDALQGLEPEATASLVPVLGEQVTNLARAASEPEQRECGMFVYRIR